MSDDITNQRLAALEGRLAAVEARMAGAGTSSGTPATSGVTPLDDKHLVNPWADFEIKKDPPKWTGVSMVGLTASQASAAWHNSNAGFMAWKAGKGAAEVSVKLQTKGKNAGKPWHERDTFSARLSAAWALRNAARGPAAAPPKQRSAFDTSESDGAGDDVDLSVSGDNPDDLPFATSALTLCPHAERATRGLKW